MFGAVRLLLCRSTCKFRYRFFFHLLHFLLLHLLFLRLLYFVVLSFRMDNADGILNGTYSIRKWIDQPYDIVTSRMFFCVWVWIGFGLTTIIDVVASDVVCGVVCVATNWNGHSTSTLSISVVCKERFKPDNKAFFGTLYMNVVPIQRLIQCDKTR